MRSATVTQSRTRAVALPRPQVNVKALGVVLAAVGLLVTMFAPFVTPAGAWSAPRTVYIEETGQTLDQVFLDVWRDNGKEASYGFPITPEITLDNGHIVQYFQYARFEYWPEADANGQHFHFGKIGEELRPISLQRTTLGWNSTSAAPSTGKEMLAINQAWLPVQATTVSTTARYVDASKHTVQGGFREFWENTGEDAYLGFPLTEEYTQGGKTYQVFERGQLVLEQGGSVAMVPVGLQLAEKYNLDRSAVAQGDIPTYSEELFIAPEPEPVAVGGTSGTYTPGGGAITIDINLSTQYMTVFQGDTVIMETYISSGRPGFDTPTGTFYINLKNGTQTMEGVLGGEYYNVPDVPSVMYFTDVGHAIHGAYWHNNFGAVMSHGCINVPVELAAWLYEITPVGTPVIIHW